MRETGGASSIAGSLSAGSVSSPDRASSSRRSISAVSKPVSVTSKPSVRSVRNRSSSVNSSLSHPAFSASLLSAMT